MSIGDERLEKLANAIIFRDDVGIFRRENYCFCGKEMLFRILLMANKQRSQVSVYRTISPLVLCPIALPVIPDYLPSNMRVDSLAQMLTHGNIRAGMTVMVVDSCDGLVAGAVLERLGGFGRVINFFPGEKPKRHFLEEMNFSKEIADTLLDFPLSLVNSLKQNTDSESAESQTGTAVALNQSAGESSEAQSDIQQPVAQSGNSPEEQPLSSSGVRPGYNPVSRMSKKEKRAYFKQRKKDRKTDAEKEAQEQVGRDTVEAKKILLEKNVDCLLVASKFHPTPIVMALSEYLAPCRQVVVFSQYMEALEDCYIHLRDGGDMINFRTTETWLREYQVLPNRTHPVINMTGTGGYLLVATKVIKPD